MEEALTFSQLRKIQKEEKREEQLTNLDDEFMLKVEDYFRQKQEVGDEREYKNAKRVFEKIISQREDKIVRSAKIAAKTSGSAPSNLLPFENKLFRQLKETFDEHRQRAEERRGGEIEFEPEEFEEETMADRNDDPEETDSEEKKADEESEEGYEVVIIKSEVPEFMGTDLESYGPFEEGDEVEIPEDNAEILVNRGSAEMK